jgi:DNA-binding transcriptional ArsR family regulator
LIRITFEPDSAKHFEFAYSPLLECVLSLHVLVAPKQHALLHSWVRRMRALPPDLRRRIDAFSFLFRWHPPDFLVPAGASSSFEAELGRLVTYPAELLLEEFGRPLYDHGGHHGEGLYDDPAVRETMLQLAAAGGDASHRLVKSLLADPIEFTQQFVRLLEDYWKSAFAAEWRTVEPQLRSSITESQRLLASAGIWAVLGRLPAHTRAIPTRRELLIDLPHTHDVLVSNTNPLVLVPSVFVWPQLRVNCDKPWPAALVYATPQQAREAQPRIPPEELLRALRVLADDTRLRVLRLLAEQPRTNQELAKLVGLSEAGLSKILGRLSDAGLVSAHREGYYVVYSLAPDRIGAIAGAIHEFLGVGGDS